MQLKTAFKLFQKMRGHYSGGEDDLIQLLGRENTFYEYLAAIETNLV